MVDAFRDLHRGPEMLVLPNAWDAASARIAQAAGARAVATSSAALAWACGYADGGFLPVRELIAAVERIARVVSIPLSVDVEDGYSDDPVAVGELTEHLVARGAAGINLEDGSKPPSILVEKIAAIKARLRANGTDVFINARCDVYLRELVAEPAMQAEAIERGGRYSAAGADGFFVPFVDPPAIRTVAGAVPLPLNVLSVPELPPNATLKDDGVRRLSAGSSIAKAMYSDAAAAARAFLEDGRFRAAAAPLDLNALLKGDGRASG